MSHLKIHFHPISAAGREILIAQLSEAGFEGFEEGTDFLSAYIEASLFDEVMLQQVTIPDSTSCFREIIEEKNWNEEWEKNFEPVRVGDFCIIRAFFHPAAAGVAHDIIITPKMSFGTGHHATTYMMLEAMQAVDMEKKKVLDFGTGTGVLAILAEKLGANDITAIDNDNWSISNAAENIEANHCFAISLFKAAGLEMPDKYDVILANINKHVILSSLSSIAQHLAAHGVLLISGLLVADSPEVTARALESGLERVAERTHNGWLMLTFTKTAVL